MQSRVYRARWRGGQSSIAKSKAIPTRNAKRPFVQIVGCAVLSLASNICSPLFSPSVGVGLVFVAIACWVLSFYPAEKWVRGKFREAPITSVIVVLLLIGLAIFTGKQTVNAYHREWGMGAITTQREHQKDCSGDTGPAIATGTGNIANSGNCTDSKLQGQSPPKSDP